MLIGGLEGPKQTCDAHLCLNEGFSLEVCIDVRLSRKCARKDLVIGSECLLWLCLARIKGAFEMNNIQGGRATCYMDELRLLGSFCGAQNGRVQHLSPGPHPMAGFDLTTEDSLR
jgi:hypothetical protein